MTTVTEKNDRPGSREGALSRDVIVQAAIEILDAEGEKALTFRALSSRLATGPGAIYWHVAGKAELLAIAADSVIARDTAGVKSQPDPWESIRAISLLVFDALRGHPWVGAQLAHAPWQPAILRILESIGRQTQVANLPERMQFDAASSLVNYILGMAGQYAAGARMLTPDIDRAAFLTRIAADWTDRHIPEEYPFVHQVARKLPEHNDRDQFLTGINLLLAGIAASL